MFATWPAIRSLAALAHRAQAVSAGQLASEAVADDASQGIGSVPELAAGTGCWFSVRSGRLAGRSAGRKMPFAVPSGLPGWSWTDGGLTLSLFVGPCGLADARCVVRHHPGSAAWVATARRKACPPRIRSTKTINRRETTSTTRRSGLFRYSLRFSTHTRPDALNGCSNYSLGQTVESVRLRRIREVAPTKPGQVAGRRRRELPACGIRGSVQHVVTALREIGVFATTTRDARAWTRSRGLKQVASSQVPSFA
jgi:hypothetical protein